MNLKGFIFDLDGVVVFTDKLHYRAWKSLSDRLGIYFDEKINERLKGVSRADSLEIILERYSGKPFTKEEKEELMTEKNEYYKSLLMTMDRGSVEPEIRETLETLKNRGFKLAIGSSSRNAKLILKQTELDEFFDAVSDGNNIKKSKPDPEVFLKAAAMLGLKPDECAVVEDAEAGIKAVKAGGMVAIGTGNARLCTECDVRIERLGELLLLK